MELFSLRTGLKEIGERVIMFGERVSPRGMPTRELLDQTLKFQEPYDSLPVGINRKVNLGIAAVEALQLIAGVSHPELMLKVQPRFAEFMNDGELWGAYGPRTDWQLELMPRKLLDDPDTRQAVVTIWDPKRDNIAGKRDYPCTVMQQFLIRDDNLILSTTMRSNDVFLGLSFDVFMFTQTQITMARAADVAVGPYHHHAVSLHVYERDFDAIRALTSPGPLTLGEYFRPAGIGRHAGEPWSYYAKRARRILYDMPLKDETQSEAWYRETLARYR